jgi:hypothetical protein
MSWERLRDRARAIAQTQLGVFETGHNTGPEVDMYLKAAGLPPGQAWCAAFVVWCYVQAAKELGIKGPLPIKRTGKVTHLWQAGAARFGTQHPVVGSIYCHATKPKDPESPGHCGIVTIVHPDGAITGIEGNTNANGSRAGNCVWENTRHPWYVTLGYLDVGSEITAKIRRPLS